MKVKVSHVQCVAQFGAFTTPIVSVAATADGTLLAIAPMEGDVELWDVGTGSCLCRIAVSNSEKKTNQYRGRNAQEQRDEICSLALSDDGIFLAASFRVNRMPPYKEEFKRFSFQMLNRSKIDSCPMSYCQKGKYYADQETCPSFKCK